VWVPKVLVTNVKGPKQVWIPKNKILSYRLITSVE
jgi:hypothetical protein